MDWVRIKWKKKDSLVVDGQKWKKRICYTDLKLHGKKQNDMQPINLDQLNINIHSPPEF